MKDKSVIAQPFFFLAPPLVSRRGYGFAVIQLGSNFSETLALRMCEWSARSFITFWKRELECLVSGARTKGLLPCGIYKDNLSHRVYCGERWEAFRCGDEIVFHDKSCLSLHTDPCFLSSSKVEPELWWQLIRDYEHTPMIQDDRSVEYESEWRVALGAVVEWCDKYDCVLSQIDNIDNDEDFAW